jgi:glycosyltransferase involved in cell wall biosynthesis
MHNLQGFGLAQSTVLDGIEDEILQKIELIVFSRDSCIADVPAQIERLKKLGIPYVVDIDDYWKLNKEHLLYHEFDNTANRWIELMKGAAAVTTTHARLAGKIQHHNKNVVVVPNAIDTTQPQWHCYQKKFVEPTIGWVGGTHHLPDLEIMKPAFHEMIIENKLNIALGGWNKMNDVYKVYESWMTGNGKYKKYTRIQGEDVYNYGRIYDLMDACIVPLLESKFTACKSNLKLLEAGFKGKPCIVSRVAPYTDDFTDNEVLFVDTKYDWYKNMLMLHENPNLLFDLKDALMDKVQAFEIKKVNVIREQLYTTIIHGK